MSYHIKLEDFTCSDCSSVYMPYSADVPCPKCKKINTVNNPRYFDFIDEVLASMRVHKLQNGQYHPLAWYQASLADYVQSVTFKLFNTLEYKNPHDPKAFIQKWVMSNPDGERYWNEHMLDIELKVYEAYEKYPGMKNPNLRQKISLSFRRFLLKLLDH